MPAAPLVISAKTCPESGTARFHHFLGTHRHDIATVLNTQTAGWSGPASLAVEISPSLARTQDDDVKGEVVMIIKAQQYT